MLCCFAPHSTQKQTASSLTEYSVLCTETDKVGAGVG